MKQILAGCHPASAQAQVVEVEAGEQKRLSDIGLALLKVGVEAVSPRGKV